MFRIVFILLIMLPVIASAQVDHATGDRFPFQNPSLSIDQRLNDLVSRMTLDEKVGQMLYNAPAIPRLGIPEYNWWGEALHGVARAGKATVFPQAIGLASMWNPEMMFGIATVISDEARAKHHDAERNGRRGIYEGLSFWSPNINIFRDPRWGRGMETYGEDPYLTGTLAVQFVKGMQGDDPKYLKTISTPKHFAVHSGPEPERHVFNAEIDDRDLRETYLPAFRAAVIEANAQSVMCAYNRFRGQPCCGSSELIQRILRDEWGFSGYVVSDCWAIMDFYTTHTVDKTAPEAAARALVAGTDLNCGVTYDSLGSAVRQRLVSEALVDVAVKRLFRARFRLGMFDPPELVPYARIPIGVNDSKQHKDLAAEAARQSIVLLKNDGNVLPLSKNIKTLAVIGPNANDVDLLLGNYNGLPSHPITPLAGIRQKVSGRTKVLYARGCDVAANVLTHVTVPANRLFTLVNGERQQGLKGEYFNSNQFEGKPVVSRVDSSIDFTWWEDAPAPGVRADSFSVRWTGFILPPVDGYYELGVRAFGGARLWIGDSMLFDRSNEHSVMTQTGGVVLKSGAAYPIKIEFWDRRADAIAGLVWTPPAPTLQEEALTAARSADAVIMMMGLSPRLEGEEMRVDVPGFKGGDRVDLGLPKVQEDLIRSVAAVGKPVVLVLLSGSAVAVNWEAAHIPAILETWYPGQAAGTALADVLFGDYNPAGRLPVTFYKSADQIPPFSNYSMEGKTYRYFRGEPLFPFGHGLSYTTFTYSNLKLPATIRAGDRATVSVDVRNSGSRSGDEVVELYVTEVGAPVPVPIRSLQGFRRIHLNAGETQTVSFTLTPRQLSIIDAELKRVAAPGTIEISVGGKQPGFSGVADAPTTGVISGRFTIVGTPVRIGEREY
ncbi:MAG TPA: glycoside hydrolase family 3 C-terminal domain-containing protein [Bacteroidota bacterium]|nr:glycoside hydrolase family 3 C-terminal domain-containing protein [Bacteroidota bacterium]